ncbi:MAG: NTP transferase domain-containing protein [Polyangiaceae bacterium]|jgi:choline kinase|nr:NTP transferase domain-containing protein [Polyangiaceae bacterium]
MSGVHQAIVLAAGRGHQVDGMAKVLIRHPLDGRSILDHAIDSFAGKRIIVVVGFRAIEVMQGAPQLDYVINRDWALTNNAMSLGLALNDEPTYVVSGDIFFSRDLVKHLDALGPNLVLAEWRENRALTAVHCALREDQSIAETYQGPLRDVAHPEAVGLFKISDPDLLRRWKRFSIGHGNLFVGQTLPCDGAPVLATPRGDLAFDEINTPTDYLRLLERSRSR